MTPEQEARLPVFARRAIAELRYDLTRAQNAAEAARLATDPEQSLAVIERFGDHDPIGLGDPLVTFRLQINGRWDEVFDVRRESDGRGIDVSYRGGALHVVPAASNSIRVRPTEW